MLRKTYFSMPNYDCDPNSIVLGQIIKRSNEPNSFVIQPSSPSNGETQSPTDHPAEYNFAGIQKYSFGLGAWSKIFIALGLNLDANGLFSCGNSTKIQINSLTTTQFRPTPQYLEKNILSHNEVKNYIKNHPNKSLFMITGLKVAHGANIEITSHRTKGANLQVGVDATAFTGFPISAGPHASVQNEHYENFKFTTSKDFILAYRLHRIIVRWGKVSDDKEHTKGAELLHRESFKPTAYNLKEREIDGLDIDEQDFGSDDNDNIPFEFRLEEVEDENDECQVIIPDVEHDD